MGPSAALRLAAAPRRSQRGLREYSDGLLGPGKTSSAFIAWSQAQAASHNPSPIVYGDYYYTLFDRGFFTAHDARTGQEVYGKQRIEVGAMFTSSPWAYNGKIFALSEEGDTFVFRAGPDYALLGKNPAR